jgi:hypothetical protein
MKYPTVNPTVKNQKRSLKRFYKDKSIYGVVTVLLLLKIIKRKRISVGTVGTVGYFEFSRLL